MTPHPTPTTLPEATAKSTRAPVRGDDFPVCGTAAAATVAAMALAACGGNDGQPAAASETVNALAGAFGASSANLQLPMATDEDDGTARETAQAAAPAAAAPLTRLQASRFLSQAAFGGDAAAIAEVQRLGVAGWLDTEFAKPITGNYLAMMSEGGADNTGPASVSDGRYGVEYAIWRKMISNPDVLRQRVTLALTEIIVVSVISVLLPRRGYAAAQFMDVLESEAFGNWRDLLLKVSTTPAMGAYLTFRNNKKADPATGSSPDENYAREIMQLFTIGPIKLNLDGTPVLDAKGAAEESYKGADVGGLARVFTGWVSGDDVAISPMRQEARFHETGAKTFLGTTIEANTDGVRSLEMAIDTLMKHPNMGPFIARQLIQRLVTSNPGKAYVTHVANAFNGDGVRPKGDLQATIRAILSWPRNLMDVSLTNPRRGKLREPMVRLIQWARTFKLQPSTATGRYEIGDTSNDSIRLGQSPLRAPSVFNFFRPGYIPSNTSALGRLKLTAPEFDITNEVTVAGYMNFMQKVLSTGINGMRGNYTPLLPLVANPAALLDELNTLLAAGQIAAQTLAPLAAALATIGITTEAGRDRRLHAALFFVMSAPDYIAQK